MYTLGINVGIHQACTVTKMAIRNLTWCYFLNFFLNGVGNIFKLKDKIKHLHFVVHRMHCKPSRLWYSLGYIRLGLDSGQIQKQTPLDSIVWARFIQIQLGTESGLNLARGRYSLGQIQLGTESSLNLARGRYSLGQIQLVNESGLNLARGRYSLGQIRLDSTWH